jgi:succinoglycan biosynthesis transport protein ExoP
VEPATLVYHPYKPRNSWESTRVNPAPDTELSFSEILRALSRRRQIILWVTVIFFLLSAVLCLVMTRRYEASGVVQLDRANSDSLGLENLVNATTSDASDPLTVNIDLQTEAGRLESNALALKVIKDLDLEHNRDFSSSSNPIDMVMSLLGSSEQSNTALEDSPLRRDKVLKIFAGHLTVKVTPGTRLISVKFANRDPKVAAAVVNHLIQALVDHSFQEKFTATNQVSTWLEGQLADLRKQNQALQSKVVKSQKDSGLFGMGSVDSTGKPVLYSPSLDRLQQSTAALAQAQMSTLVKSAIYQVAKTGNAELISQLNGTSIAGAAGQGVVNSLSLIQNLRVQESQLKSQLEQDAFKFGSAYPKLAEERAALKAVEDSLDQEDHRIAERAKNDYEIATKAEQGMRLEVEQNKEAAQGLNDKTVEYLLISKEASQTQDLYEDLVKRFKEAGIIEGLHSSSVTVVDPAMTPAKPSRPDVPLLLGAAVLLGIFVGACAALFIDSTDDKVLGTENILAHELPLFGVLPKSGNSDEEGWNKLLEPGYSEFSEAARRLRSNLHIPRGSHSSRVVLVTSASSGEGKAAVSVSLAISLAQAGKRVLLIEADFRDQALKDQFGVVSQGGLSSVLNGAKDAMQPVVLAKFANLSFMPAGPIPDYPAEALGSTDFASLLESWKQFYEVIVIDCPPVLPLSDTQNLEALADTTVLVAKAGVTTMPDLDRAYKMLLPHVKSSDTPGIGVVLTSLAPRSSAYRAYYGDQKYEFS